MSLKLYLFEPLSPLHLGGGRIGDPTEAQALARSDTIAAAILSLWGHIANVGDEEITQLSEKPPFAVSSTIPAIQRNRRWEPLLPVPTGLFDRIVDPSERKTYKAVRFAPADALCELLEGRMPHGHQARGEVLLPEDFRVSRLWQSNSRTRLAVNRLGDGPLEGQLFDFGSVAFDSAVRLALIVDFFDPNAQPHFEAALRLLADEGLGADRSVGYGRLKLVEEEIGDYAEPKLGHGMRLCLSLLHPTEQEVRDGLLDIPAVYSIVTRGGWISAPGASHLRRKTVSMLAEGSLVKDLGQRRYGDSPKVLEPLPELGLRHPVFRPGYAVTISARAPEGMFHE